MIHLRGPQLLRGICRRSREDVFTPDGFYPTVTWAASTRTDSCSTTDAATTCSKVSGATVYPSEVQAALRNPGVRGAFVTEVEGRVGAAVVGDGLSAEKSCGRRRARGSTRSRCPRSGWCCAPMTTFRTARPANRMFACCASSWPTPSAEIRCHRCHLTSRAIAQFETHYVAFWATPAHQVLNQRRRPAAR